MSTNVLSAKDANATMAAVAAPINGNATKPDIRSMDYHRQALQSKMEKKSSKTYISPSDNITSPCTAKLQALRGKQMGKVKPKSLFAQASAKKFEAGGGDDVLFGSGAMTARSSPPRPASPSGPNAA